MSRNSNDRPRASDPPSSVSSGSIDLEALRALVETWRTKGPNGVTLLDAWGRTVPPKSAFSTGYVMARTACSAELSVLLASLGERRGTQEEKHEARVDDTQYAAPLATAGANEAIRALLPPVPWTVKERYQAGDGDAASGSSDTAFAEVSVVAADGTVVYQCYDPNEMSGEEWDSEIAKARLFAAAPDVLSALRNWQNYEQTLEQRQNAAIAACAKAEGRS